MENDRFCRRQENLKLLQYFHREALKIYTDFTLATENLR
jgi:hypothetical protein